MTRPVITISAWSDVACPWCYVGKKRLDAAKSHFPAVFAIEWHPYMIDPKTLLSGEEYLSYNQRRWGSDSWTQDLRESGRPDGCTFENWRWWPHTLQAHRLMQLAERHGLASEVKEALFVEQSAVQRDQQCDTTLTLRVTPQRVIRGTVALRYERGGNVSDVEVLVRLGEECGLPNVAEYMAGDEGIAEVIAADQDAKSKLRIRGVPYFIIQGPQGSVTLNGAQHPTAFCKAFQRVLHAA